MASTLIGLLTMVLATTWNPFLRNSKHPTWVKVLEDKVDAINQDFEGNVGVYIEDLETSESFSYYATKRFYLASVIKIFIMVEIYRLIDEGELSWNDKVIIDASKYRDGAGYINWMAPGKKASIKKLMRAMMMKSDNAATDILIDIAGIKNIEMTVKKIVGLSELGPLTTILDVRRQVFRTLHPVAANFSSAQFMDLWRLRNFEKKLDLFTRMVGKPRHHYSRSDLIQAYETFYRTGANSGSLFTLSEILKGLALGKIVSRQQSSEMIDLLRKCKTGKGRILAGMPPGWTFAHKTGTQMRRICDAGVAYGPGGDALVIVMCAEGFTSMRKAEKVFAQISNQLFQARKPSS